MKTMQMLAILALAIGLQASPVLGKVIYVDASATGANDGSSWQDAYKFLQDGISAAAPNDQIWVSTGIYQPDKGLGYTLGDRTASFVLKNMVRILGGFPPGGGTLEQRNPDNETILSGDLKGNDKPNIKADDLPGDNNRSENSYHVVKASRCGLDTVLDMVTVKGGHASVGTHYRGAGLYISDSGNPTISQCVFENNCAPFYDFYYQIYGKGGAIFVADSSCKPVLTKCTFRRNYAYMAGGAIYFSNSSALLQINNCTFSENYAGGSGGAIANYSSRIEISECSFDWNLAGDIGGAVFNDNNSNPTLNKCSFERNGAKKEGGAICNLKGSSPLMVHCSFIWNESQSSNGGAIKNDGGSNPNLVNCLFNSNSAHGAGGGGAMHNVSSSPMLVNCTLFYNYTNGNGGGIYNSQDSQTTLSNCILWLNKDQGGGSMGELAQIWYGDANDPKRPIVNYCCIMGWTGKLDGQGNFDKEPRFWDPDGYDFRLDLDSPCIDAGDNTAVPSDIKVDLKGVNRFQKGPGIPTGKGTPPIVDIGAYEVCSLRLLPANSPIRQDWEILGQPDCWCGPFQCDGDADGEDSGGISKYRVFTGDLDLIVANWKKKIGDPTLNPCADIDHKDSGGINKFRVFTGDLNILVANWKKKDADLRGDCPRP